jgi:hypothetical protein
MKFNATALNDLRTAQLLGKDDLSGLLDDLGKSIAVNHGLNVTVSIPIGLSDTLVTPSDLTQINRLVRPPKRPEDVRDIVAGTKSLLGTRKKVLNSIPYNLLLSPTAFSPETNHLGKAIRSGLTKIETNGSDLSTSLTAFRARLSKYRFTTVEQFRTDLVTLYPIKIPFTNKRLIVMQKSPEERNFSIIEYIRLAGAYGALITFLDRRITDWVLLKAATAVAFVYLFVLFAREFYDFKLENIETPADDTAVIQIANHLQKHVINLT